MTAITPANLPALVRRQWDRTDDVMYPLVWAEWLEEHGQPERGELVRLLHEGRHALDCDCTRCRRSRELRRQLSAWKCVCAGVMHFTGDNPCPVCDGTGDVLKTATVNGGDVFGNFPLTWDCGFPRWVTLPTLVGDAVSEEIAAMGFTRDVHRHSPTPRLRALAQTPPWGVPLDGVRAADREPEYVGYGWCWRDEGRENGPENIPSVLLTGEVALVHPTEPAAADALARGLLKFAREYKG